MGTFESVQAQYERNKQSASSNKFANQEERQKKYFTTVLPKGVTSGEKRIRILPTKDGSSPFIEAYYHEVQVGGKWVKLYDPMQDGKRSPLNEVKKSLEETGDESDKELSKNYRAKKFYIVKVIDRDHESDGVKFWRFKHNSKGEGIMDKIFPIFKSKGDITDPEKGRDLTISLSITTSNNGKEYTQVNSIIHEDPGKLSENKDQEEEWINDTLTWSDVYSKKPEEYLEIVANGETPKWSTELKKWVSMTEAEETIGESKSSSAPIPDPQENEEPEEDLPF